MERSLFLVLLCSSLGSLNNSTGVASCISCSASMGSSETPNTVDPSGPTQPVEIPPQHNQTDPFSPNSTVSSPPPVTSFSSWATATSQMDVVTSGETSPSSTASTGTGSSTTVQTTRASAGGSICVSAGCSSVVLWAVSVLIHSSER